MIDGRACVSCHYRKVRCDVVDKGSPCTECRAHGRFDCQVYQKKKTRSARTTVNVPIVPKFPSATQDEGHEPGNLAELIYRQDLRDAELGHLGRMCFIGSDVSNFNYLVRQTSQPQSRSAFHFGSRQFHRKHTAHELQRVPQDALERCETGLELRLLRAYFDKVNPGWPIVDEEHFMAQYQGKDMQNPLMLPLLNAILLVGAHVLGGSDKSIAQLQATYFRRAKALIDCRFEQDRTMYVQVALLLTWYSDGHEEIVANAWHWIGFAIRIAIGHGMHRDVTHSKMLPVHRRSWTRLWWILYQFDTTVSAAYGRPQTLNLAESDVPDLEPAHFQGIPKAQVDFAIYHAKLCTIFAEVMKKRWALRSSTQERIQASRQADEALAEFMVNLPPPLKLSFSRLSPWTATLHLTYNNFVLLLHRPPPLAMDEVAIACADSSLCGGATATMSSIFETICHHGDASTLWLYSVHAMFTALIQVSNELSSPRPMLAASSQIIFDTLMDALKCLSRYWQFAENILRLFRQRESLIKDALNSSKPEAESFALRPAPPAPVADTTSWESTTNGHATLGFERESVSTKAVSYSPLQNDTDLHPEELIMEEFPDSFALELFLAGMDGSTQDSG